MHQLQAHGSAGAVGDGDASLVRSVRRSRRRVQLLWRSHSSLAVDGARVGPGDRPDHPVTLAAAMFARASPSVAGRSARHRGRPANCRGLEYGTDDRARIGGVDHAVVAAILGCEDPFFCCRRRARLGAWWRFGETAPRRRHDLAHPRGPRPEHIVLPTSSLSWGRFPPGDVVAGRPRCLGVIVIGGVIGDRARAGGARRSGGLTTRPGRRRRAWPRPRAACARSRRAAPRWS